MTLAGWILMVLLGIEGSLLSFVIGGSIVNLDQGLRAEEKADRFNRHMRNVFIGACLGAAAILAVWIGGWLLDELPEGIAWLWVVLGAVLIDGLGVLIVLTRLEGLLGKGIPSL